MTVQRRRGLRCLAVGLLGCAGLHLSAAAGEFERGRALYENHCRSCHENWAHTRAGRVVNTLAGLRERVASWSVHSGLNWRAEEIDDVTDYLNRRFYQLAP